MDWAELAAYVGTAAGAAVATLLGGRAVATRRHAAQHAPAELPPTSGPFPAAPGPSSPPSEEGNELAAALERVTAELGHVTRELGATRAELHELRLRFERLSGQLEGAGVLSLKRQA